MRMRIGSRRLTMGSPTGMGDTYTAATVLVCSHRLQVTHLTLCLIHIQLIQTINQCHTSTVISTILQFLQPLNKNRISIILSYISNYSTIVYFLTKLFFICFFQSRNLRMSEIWSSHLSLNLIASSFL